MKNTQREYYLWIVTELDGCHIEVIRLNRNELRSRAYYKALSILNGMDNAELKRIQTYSVVGAYEDSCGNLDFNTVDYEYVLYRDGHNVVYMGDDDKEVNYDAAVMLMDDEIREQIHSQHYYDTPQSFMVAYCEAHAEKYGVEFTI